MAEQSQLQQLANRSIEIAGRSLGDGHPCFITYEAGPTHDGVETAIRLVQEASRAGADAVKFQIFDADRLVADRKQLFTYSILQDRATGELEEVSEPLHAILKRRCLEPDQWRKVKAQADACGLAFFATIGFEEDLSLLMDLGCHSVKIASADVDHAPLLRLAARSGLNVQVDTGNAEISEIANAVQILESEGCDSIIIHQCPSGYPARLPSVCLRMISTLRDHFPSYPIAYSDHTPEADLDIAAVALGANLVEKTITLDRCTRNVEHIFSLEPDEMQDFIRRLRDVETALGTYERHLTEEQKRNRKLLRRSPYAVSAAEAGTTVTDLPVEFRRPGTGLTPMQWEKAFASGMQLSKAIGSGEQLCQDHIS
ncbi:N-acetylneuraminate synthase family protein [bacterium]|nr:N-acetylneuraminate synthase family protein [bacterium]